MTPAGIAIAPGNTTAGAAFEQYNSFNGNLNISFPLHHIGGRGESGFDLMWNAQPGWIAAYNGTPGGNAFLFAEPYPSSNIAGASNNAFGLGGPGAVYIRTGYTWFICSGGNAVPSQTVTTITFVTSSGAQISLLDTDTNGAPQATPSNFCTTFQPATWGSRGTSFRSADGSQLQFNATAAVPEQAPNGHGYGIATASGTLIFPNGVKYSIVDSQIRAIEDRNGNAITLVYGGPPVNIDWYLSIPALTQATDSLGRTTNINYADSSCTGCLSINWTGGGGAARNVKVFTGSLQSSGNLRTGYPPNETIATLFSSSVSTSTAPYNPTIATAIQQPDGSQYTFQYNPYGEVARVTLPTGGAIEYDYVPGSGTEGGLLTGNGGAMIYRRLSARREYANGGNGSSYTSETTHTVAYPAGQTTDTVEVLGPPPDNSLFSKVVHTMVGAANDSLAITGTGCNAWNEGLELQTDLGSPDVTVTNTWVTQSGCTSNPQLQARVTTLNDTNQQSKISYQYDLYGNVMDEIDYDWGNGAPGAPIREINATYEWAMNVAAYGPTGLNLVHAPFTRFVCAGGLPPGTCGTTTNQTAQTIWHYDGSDPVEASGITNHDSGYDISFKRRGNVTFVDRWLAPGSFSSQGVMIYDIAGNLRTITDQKGHVTPSPTTTTAQTIMRFQLAYRTP